MFDLTHWGHSIECCGKQAASQDDKIQGKVSVGGDVNKVWPVVIERRRTSRSGAPKRGATSVPGISSSPTDLPALPPCQYAVPDRTAVFPAAPDVARRLRSLPLPMNPYPLSDGVSVIDGRVQDSAQPCSLWAVPAVQPMAFGVLELHGAGHADHNQR